MTKTLFILGITAMAASAQFIGGLGYSNLSLDEGPDDYNLGIAYASLGYEMSTGSGFTIVPEVRLGTGVSDDKIRNVATVNFNSIDADYSVNTYASLLLNTKLEFGRSFYGIANLHYTYLEREATAVGISFETDEWLFGVGAGLGYQFSDAAALEFNAEFLDGAEFLGGSLKFKF